MKKSILVLVSLLVSGALFAPAAFAEGGQVGFHFKPDLGSQASLQRGARDFMNYCAGCHSLKYLRYERMADDLGIPMATLKQNLIFTGVKVGEPMRSAMATIDAAQSAKWFGNTPPDLSYIARYRGVDWVYSYLKSFYRDASRPHGSNNLVLPGVAMPNVLETLQGIQVLVKGEGEGEHAAPQLELAQPGSLTPRQFDRMVGDITNFLVYAAEPAKMVRYQIGFYVILFLLLFTALAWLLYKEYWKDVH